MRNKLFDDEEIYNNLGRKWSKRIDIVLKPLIASAVRQRISMHDLLNIIQSNAALLCAFGNCDMRFRDERKRKKRRR